MKVGIVGAGNMGSGIAQKYATEGHEVTLCDNLDAGLERGKTLIENTLQEGLARRIFNEARVQQINGRLKYSTNLADLRDADLVIEAVFEDRSIKQELFRDLDAICSPQTILATNTSSFYVAELASVTNRPNRLVGLHYFYHPAKNRLVEVIRTPETSDDTFSKVFALQEAIGKIPITSVDSPGFVVNRFFVPWLNEAMRLVEEGVANIPTIESAAKKSFGIGMGPFELMNVTGVPITLHAATTLYNALGDFYKPSDLIRPVVASKASWDLSGDVNESALAKVESRLWNVVLTIAQKMVLVEKVCSIEECDLGARVGLRWKRGPFEILGLKDSALLPKKVVVTREDKIGVITLNRPDSMNAIDDQMVRELEAAIERLTNDASIDGIILNGKGKSFAAGADTQFFVEKMQGQQIQHIVDFAAYGQKVLRKIDTCPKPVVALVHGMTLGGGLELALACDRIVCVEGSLLGFPETGIGIYPGLGGTQRTPRRIGVALARWLILSGELLSAQKAFELGLADVACSAEEAMKAALQFVGSMPLAESRRAENWQELESFFQKPLKDLQDPKLSPVNIDIQKALKKIAQKAPIALRVADELISASSHVTIEEGLQRETNQIATIFSTKDALIGISSIGNGRPVFSGT
jgi:enoyl-CoA hydratase/3-hydroxyacyl-CoA dehydrogenase